MFFKKSLQGVYCKDLHVFRKNTYGRFPEPLDIEVRKHRAKVEYTGNFVLIGVLQPCSNLKVLIYIFSRAVSEERSDLSRLVTTEYVCMYVRLSVNLRRTSHPPPPAAQHNAAMHSLLLAIKSSG